MISLPTRILLSAALLAGAAAAPASAATVRHVEAGGTAVATCSAEAPCGTVPDAIAAAAPGDTIRIGAGEFAGTGFYITKPLKFEGAGTAQTTVKGLMLDAGGLVRHLRLSSPGVALFVPGGDATLRVEDVALDAGEAGMEIRSGKLFADKVVIHGTQPGADGIVFGGTEGELHDVTMDDGSLDRGLFMASGILRLDDAAIRADYGAQLFSGATTITRARIDASETGITMAYANNLELGDSVVVAHGATAPAVALRADAVEAAPMSATVVRSTLAAAGPYARAVDVHSVDGKGNVALVGSIAAAQGGGAIDVAAKSATVLAQRSAYRTVDVKGSGSVPAPGTQGNLSVAPGFADPAAGDWSLAQDSALVDAGDPAVLPADLKDAAGAPRMADGNGDGTARVDLGGLEHVFKAPATAGGGAGGGDTGGGSGGGGEAGPAPDTTAPVVANLRVRRRAAKVRFTLSEAARVTVKVSRRGNVVRRVERAAAAGTVTVRLRRRAIRIPGRYRVIVRAVDAAGNAALPVRAAFRVR